MLAAQSIRNSQDGYVSSAYAEQQPDLLMVFNSAFVEHAYPGQAIFFEGDRANHIFAVIEGTLRICRLLPDGRRVIIGFLHSGDIVGVSFKNYYLYSAEAIDTVSFRRMTRRAFEDELETSPNLRPAILSTMRDEVCAAQDQMVLLSCKNAEERLSSFLFKELKRETARGMPRGLINLAMTRLDIADYLGMTIETVSRTISKLALKGIIAPPRRHEIKVLNIAALAHLAADDAEYDCAHVTTLRSAADRRHWG